MVQELDPLGTNHERPTNIINLDKIPPWIRAVTTIGLITATTGYFIHREAEKVYAKATDVSIEGPPCRPDAYFYRVQEGDNLHYIARESGVFPLPVPVPDDIFDGRNPGLADPEVNRDIIWARMDILALPPNERVFTFVRNNNLPPYPNAPEDIKSRLEDLDPGSLASIQSRTEAVLLAVFGHSNTVDQQTKRDLCIFKIHRQGRTLSHGDLSLDLEILEQVLAEHELRYLENGYVRFMFEQKIPTLLPDVNQLLASSGVNDRLPQNLTDYAVFKSLYNDVGGGLAAPGSHFEIYGNYYDPMNRLVDVLGKNRENNFLRDVFRLATETLIQPQYAKPSLESERVFARSALDLIALPSRLSTDEDPQESLDPRIAYLHRSLWETDMDPIEALKTILRSAATFQDIETIRQTYDQNRYRDQPPFDLLFDPSFHDNRKDEAHDYYEYTVNKPSEIDFYDDFDYILEIVQRLTGD